MAFSLDGRWVATTGKDNLAKVWNGENGRAVSVMQGHTSWVNTVSFSPDGKQLLTGGYDLTARLWASDTGENRFVLGGHRGGIYCAVFSPDGKAVATCDEEVARLWDASSGKLIRELTGHTGTVTDAVLQSPLAAVKPVFSRDGQLIVVGGIDPHARLDGSTDFNLVRIPCLRRYCAPFDQLLALARQRLTRTLSPAERQIYLHERIRRSTSPQ